jgi:DNA replication protein DnaC
LEFETDSDQLETDKEDQLKESDILNLLQADGSQEEIIKEARYKKGMVVHGPPGTGKSQVIVNLITDALQQQKKVWYPFGTCFVSSAT